MAAITETTAHHAVGSEESSPAKVASPTKLVQTSPVATSDKGSSPPARDGAPAPDLLTGSARKENGDETHENANVPENGTEHSPEVSEHSTHSEIPVKNSDDASDSSDKPEEGGAPSGEAGEVEQPEEGRPEGGEPAAACPSGAEDCGGKVEKDAGDLEHKIDLIKLDVSPKVQSPTKTSCAAV